MKLEAQWLGVAVAGLGVAMGGAQTQTHGRKELQTTILQTLINDPELGQYPLAASVGTDHTVVLNGVVPNKQDKEQAARLVKSIAGVKGVDNEISVDAKATPLPNPASATPAQPAALAATPNGQPSFGDIQTTIQNALATNPGLDGVKTTVHGEKVTLTGTVANQQDKKRAEQVARKYAAKLKVVNKIAVRSEP